MKRLLIFAVVLCAGCVPGKDVSMARVQNPALAKYADEHDCHPYLNWEPRILVEDDGSEHMTRGKVFYNCPNDAVLIMDFTPEPHP